MDIYLIRHAEAVDCDDANFSDEERPLTELGRAQARALAAAFVARGVRFDTVIASPLVRTRETAEQMLQNMPGPLASLEFSRHLAPDGKQRKLMRRLLGVEGDSVALIGHDPDLADFVGKLIGTRKTQVEIAKAGVAHIRCDGLPGKGRGILVWLLTPEWVSAPQETPKPSVVGF